MSDEALDLLELELRSLPSVVGVGFTDEGESLIVHLLANGSAGVPQLRRQATQHARAHLDRPVVIEVDSTAPEPENEAAALAAAIGGGPSGGQRGRVQLVAVRVASFAQEIEVHLSHHGVRTVGRGQAGTPTGAAAATINALAGLGAVVPFKVEAAAAPVQEQREHAVVVLIDPADEVRGGRRYGVARGGSIEEAACRATLHALNRYLEREGVFAAAV